MASISGKSGKCSNFGNCSIADARTPVEVPGGLDFVCNECGKPLLLIDSGTKGGNSKALAVGALLLILVLAGGGIAWSLMAGKKSPETMATEKPKNNPPAESPSAKPASGTCSDADERVGLCRAVR